jgi:hypothetical protein
MKSAYNLAKWYIARTSGGYKEVVTVCIEQVVFIEVATVCIRASGGYREVAIVCIEQVVVIERWPLLLLEQVVVIERWSLFV